MKREGIQLKFKKRFPVELKKQIMEFYAYEKAPADEILQIQQRLIDLSACWKSLIDKPNDPYEIVILFDRIIGRLDDYEYYIEEGRVILKSEMNKKTKEADRQLHKLINYFNVNPHWYLDRPIERWILIKGFIMIQISLLALIIKMPKRFSWLMISKATAEII